MISIINIGILFQRGTVTEPEAYSNRSVTDKNRSINDKKKTQNVSLFRSQPKVFPETVRSRMVIWNSRVDKSFSSTWCLFEMK